MPEQKDPNVIWVGAAGFRAHKDRVIVMQDEYRSGYECETCQNKNKHTVSGKEVSTVTCEDCKGEGKRGEKKCSTCQGHGWIVCPECAGRGGLLVMAEKSEGRPTTGTIVSVGKDVETEWKLGDKVIYPSHAGHAYDLEAVKQDGTKVKVVLVILRDQEILSRMYGVLEQNQVKRSAALHTAA